MNFKESPKLFLLVGIIVIVCAFYKICWNEFQSPVISLTTWKPTTSPTLQPTKLKTLISTSVPSLMKEKKFIYPKQEQNQPNHLSKPIIKPNINTTITKNENKKVITEKELVIQKLKITTENKKKDFVLRQPLEPIVGHPRLKIINCGAGGTGTFIVSEILSKHGYVPSLHYRQMLVDIRLTKDRSELSPILHHSLRNCALKFNNESSCVTKLILTKISNFVKTVSKNFMTISDTPMSWLCVEFATRVPKILIMISERNNTDLVNYRLGGKVEDVLCKPEFWDHRNVMHPFDIVGCLQLVSLYASASSALTTTGAIAKQQGSEVVVAAYEKMNEIHKIVVRSSRVLPLTVFGFKNEKMAYNAAEQKIIHFLNETAADSQSTASRYRGLPLS